ncbi:MAG TPA: alpha/beta fold hydrolase [Nonomuraea sp.]|nr:alpha/beta fold hydrolase [Nonomuraea sp.]
MTSSAVDEKWVRRFHPHAGNAARLVCFPHAGGSASHYFWLSQALTSSIEVLALQYPGRQDRRLEACVDSIPALADNIVQALRGWLDGPYAFFGHSMGAVIAFEVARRLERQSGEGPKALVVSSRRAPSRWRDSTVHQRDDAGILSELRLIDGTDQRWLDDEELMASLLPTIRADYKAIETHSYAISPPLSCPITALVGDRDPYTTVDEATAWRQHTSREFDLHVFTGGHFYLETHRAEVTALVSAAFDRAASAASIEGSTP